MTRHAPQPAETLWQGRYLEMKRRGTWEYVDRPGNMHAVVILAIDDGHVLLVDQYRVPLGGRSLELPAGLVGDESAEDSVEAAAHRELEEETGYRAERFAVLGDFITSPGMTSESFTLVRAEGLTRVGEGGGIGSEDIIVRRVALAELPAYVAQCRAQGMQIDVKLLLLLAPTMLGWPTMQG